MELWYIRKHHGAANLWQSYLAYRVKNETNPEAGRLVEIRQVAEHLCPQTEAKYEATLDTLCWLALERGAFSPAYRPGWKSKTRRFTDPDEIEPPDPSLNLLSAATYFGYVPLVRRLLSDGHCPTSDNDLFPSPMQLAAWAGNPDMLRLFQEDMKMLRLAIYPPSRSLPHSTDFAGQPFGHVDPQSKPGSDLRAALYFAKSWEVFRYIDSFFEDSILESEWDMLELMKQHIALGNVEMVQQFLDVGAPVHSPSKWYNYDPLGIAARYCHEDVLDLLLSRGADPNIGRSRGHGPTLLAAVEGGSVLIVRKLLDHGAKIPEGDGYDYWLRYAVYLEHTAMVELLLELTSPHDRSVVLRYAISKGLESMAELLQQLNVEPWIGPW